MMKMQKKNFREYRQKILATTISLLCTGLISTSVTQASDIDIYQEAKSGEITLMFMLDISGSMSRYYNDSNGYGCDLPSGVSDKGRSFVTEAPITGGPSYRRQWCLGSDGKKYYDRITRLKDGMIDLLYGNSSKKIQKLSDDKVIGLSTLGEPSTQVRGAVVVPARRLDAIYNGKTQRQILIDQIIGFTANTVTPTARSYAEVVSYLMGTTTVGRTDLQAYFGIVSGGTNYYQVCTSWAANGTCNGTWNGWYTGSVPSGYTKGAAGTLKGYNGNYYYGADSNDPSGFKYSDIATKNSNGTLYQSPASLAQTDDVKKCSGQGIYVLTDGDPNYNNPTKSLMQRALGANGSTFDCDDSSAEAWECTSKLSLAILDATNNPKALKFKTAVVGFGGSFNKIPSYSKQLTQQQNLTNIDDSSASSNQKEAARWGVKAEGGWYSGNSSQDIVDSVNAFLGEMGTDIPAVTTGSPTVPKDSLNPSNLQKEAYFPQFQPTPDKPYQLWSGNLKKYKVVNGILRDKSSNKIVDNKGRIIDNFDLWSTAVDTNQTIKDADENTYGSTKFALKGGAWSQLKLKINTATNADNRKLLTNRMANTSNTPLKFENSATLKQVTSGSGYLTDPIYKNDPNRGYLMSLLGYSVDATNPNAITATSLTNSGELRQIGAVMHSSPILITNKGKITYKNGVVGTENREDYALFGTTQGLLHVVDAKTGVEKFAFVPNEMIENQKDAFLKHDVTTGGTNKLYYGIDAPWSTYTEYVIDSSRNLTVGSGLYSQKGKQIAYGGLRMGGRSYYALDLQNIDNPKLLFQISPADQKVYSTANNSGKPFSQLQYMGQSWSKPTITWVKWGKSRKRVMFVGGGYDAGGDDGDGRVAGVKGAYAGYESSDYAQTNKKGGGVYMFDAENGDLLWWSSANATNTTTGVIGVKADDLKYSVVSEIRAEDRNGDGLADHLYFGDLGGQLFRIDIDNDATSTATFSKIPRMLLNLNAGAKSPRFYEMPAFSIYDYAGNTFAVISIGSGNRSVPLQEYTVGTSGYDYDAVYNIYDRDVTARNLFKAGYTFSTPTLTKANLGEVTAANRNNTTTLVAPYPASATAKQGWFYRFQSYKIQSAKVLATPTVLNSRLFVTTFDGSKPGLSGDCGAGVKGESFVNQFCMPYGQCELKDPNGAVLNPECSSGDGCSLGAGITDIIIVDPKDDCDPTKEVCGVKLPESDDGTNNKNYCISTGGRAVATPSGPIGNANTRRCLVPQRWYERSR